MGINQIEEIELLKQHIKELQDGDERVRNIMWAQIGDLQEVVRLLVFHVHRDLTQPDARVELEQSTAETPMKL